MSLIYVTTFQWRELATLVRGFQKCVDHHHRNSIVDCEGNDYIPACCKDNDVNEENQGFLCFECSYILLTKDAGLIFYI